MWLLSLSIISPRTIPGGTNGKISLCTTYVHYDIFIHLSNDGHLGGFHFLAVVNNTAMNTKVHIFFQSSVLGIFRHGCGSGIAGSKSQVTTHIAIIKA